MGLGSDHSIASNICRGYAVVEHMHAGWEWGGFSSSKSSTSPRRNTRVHEFSRCRCALLVMVVNFWLRTSSREYPRRAFRLCTIVHHTVCTVCIMFAQDRVVLTRRVQIFRRYTSQQQGETGAALRLSALR